MRNAPAADTVNISTRCPGFLPLRFWADDGGLRIVELIVEHVLVFLELILSLHVVRMVRLWPNELGAISVYL